jgi:hypothetical protein
MATSGDFFMATDTGHHHCGAKRISWKAANTYIG